jgi:hypothetical protein
MPELPAAFGWLVFVSPPWAMFTERPDDVVAVVAALLREAPPGSTFVVEADGSFPVERLPDPAGWQTRPIPPAVLHMRAGLVS